MQNRELPYLVEINKSNKKLNLKKLLIMLSLQKDEHTHQSKANKHYRPSSKSFQSLNR
jgi:hypothetical protein